MKNFTMQYSSFSHRFGSVSSALLMVLFSWSFVSANNPLVAPLTGTTWYVSVSGNDANPGTSGSPFATIQAAVAAASSGDAIEVAAGTYNGPITVNKKLDINGAGMGSTIVQASGGTAFTYTASGSGSGASDRAKLRNLTVSGSDKGIRVDQLLNYFTIENVKFDGCTTYGIHINNVSGSMNDWEITSCEFDGNGTGIYGSTASGINGISITGTVFQNQIGSGIYIGQSSSSPGTWTNVTISTCTFQGNGVSGGSGNGAIYAEKLSSATISSNMMSDNGNASNPRGISINLKYGSYSNIVITSNIIAETRAISINGYGINVQARNESPDYNAQPASLTGLDISNNAVTQFAGGIVIHNAVDWGSTTINNNAVANCTQGIGAVVYPSGNTANSSATLDVHDNSITGATYTILNGATNGASIDAECNWHGTATCAGVDAAVASYPDVCPPYGTAGPVDYTNWLASGTDSDGSTTGFQPAPGNCTGAPTASTTITVTETSGTSNDGTICNGASATLTATSGASYLWSTGETSQAIVVPPSTSSTYSVTVTNAFACAGNASTSITVINAPTIGSIAPLSGTIGAVITVTGTNFTGATQVKLNGVNCPTFTVVSATQISVTMPFGGAILNGSVTTQCGTANISTGVPALTSFSPSSGAPGSLITITGNNLTGASSVTVGGTEQLILSNSTNSVTIFLMPGTPTGQIAVTTSTGVATSSGNFTVTTTPVPQVQQGTKRVGTGATAISLQGQSVAVSADGNTAIIGAPSDNSNQGGAWVFVRSGTTWTQQGGKLVGTGAVGSAKQGFSVAVSADGNTAAIGGNLDNLANGAVWVFTRSGISWSQQGAKLVGTGNTGFAQQGSALSLSADGNTLAIGGIGDDSYAGAAWVFTRVGGVWSQQGGKLVGTGATGAARQGCSVSLSSDANYLAVGGYNDNSRQGAAWIYSRSGTVWSQQGGKLFGTGGSSTPFQGYAVALNANGNTLISGGPNDASTLTGAAWVFTRSGTTWSQQGGKLVGTGTGASGASRQGGSVAISADGNTAVWGGFGDATNAGAMWVYKRTGSSWGQQGAKLTGTGASGPAKQGTSIALCSVGNTAILGGPTDASNKGAAWVYVTSSSSSFTPSLEDRQQEVATVSGFSLHQNTPNPATDRTTVTFTLPEACTADWQITDVNGRVIFSLQREYPAGENTEIFDMSRYNGLFRYTLKTPFGVKTRNMTVIR